MSDTLPRFRGRPVLLAAALGLLVVGGGAGALAVEASRPSVTMAPATPVAIRTLTNDDDSIITVRGRVAEVYGNKFVMADASGRALVDTGREGEDGTLVRAGQPVTVQGRFDRGLIHAAFLVGADGKAKALGPLGGPPHDRRGLHGAGPDRGPGMGPEGAAPPPAPAVVPAPAPTATAPAA
ncbi:hypothetical protein U1701_01220 [Sphingomonas sp. PB2P19]|uniref:hypothetical protein n=1 Tax=Sphingomonas rhamnosi TaxID=3096156 RepID=UPI002FC93647